MRCGSNAAFSAFDNGLPSASSKTVPRWVVPAVRRFVLATRKRFSILTSSFLFCSSSLAHFASSHCA